MNLTFASVPNNYRSCAEQIYQILTLKFKTMQNSIKRHRSEKLPNCETEFVGYGDSRRIMQTFSKVIVLENWLVDQRAIVRFNGRIIYRTEHVTVRKWKRMVWIINLAASVLTKVMHDKQKTESMTPNTAWSASK